MQLRRKFIALLAGLFASSIGLQAQFVWTGSSVTNGLVTDTTNWQGGSAPGGVSGTENVTYGDIAGTQVSVLVPSLAWNNLTFNGSNRPPYNFGGSGGTPTLTLNGNIVVGAGNQVTFSSSLALILATGIHTVDVNVGSPGLQVNGSIGGAGALTKTGSSTLTLAGTNTYSGGTTINTGSLILSGSISHATANTTVAQLSGDNATVAISGGGSISNSTGIIANLTGSIGTVTVTGPGSSWTNNVYLYVGGAGQGSLTINSGGTVSSANTSTGNNTGGFGFITVDGAGSTLTNSNTLYVGSQGSGILNLTNGGQATDVNGSIGNNAGGNGNASVYNPGSLWTNTGNLFVGNATSGSLYVGSGGQVTSATGYIGTLAGVTGTASVDGAGSQWSNSGNLYIGYSGTGLLTLLNGGRLTVNNGAGTITFGSQSGSTGGISLGDGESPAGIVNAGTITTGAGTGSLLLNTATSTSIAPYYLTRDGTAAGTAVVITGPTLVGNLSGFNVLAGANTYTGGTVIFGGTLSAGSNSALGTGMVTIDGGNLNVATGVTLTNPIVFGSNPATLSGNGTFGSLVTVGSNVFLSPGNSPGTLTFTAGLTFAPAGTLNFEVQSAAGPAGTGYDLLSISGAALDISATNGTPFTLKLISLNAGGTAGNVSDFSSASNYSWIVATSTAGITNFAANKFVIDTSSFGNSLGIGSFSLLQGVSGGNPALFLNFTSVPEPSTYALMIMGLGAVFISVRRRNSVSP